MPIMTPTQVQAECQRIAGRGLHAAARTYTNLVKQTLSVPAPRRGKVGRYRATTRAIAGAPPRKLSGRLRTSMATEFDKETNTARSGTNVFYGRIHEVGPGGETGKHPFLIPTLEANLTNLSIVAGHEIQTARGSA